jgi:hypothetical protein
MKQTNEAREITKLNKVINDLNELIDNNEWRLERVVEKEENKGGEE